MTATEVKTYLETNFSFENEEVLEETAKGLKKVLENTVYGWYSLYSIPSIKYLDTETDVFEPILRDEDEAKQMSGVTVFVEDESRVVMYRLLEELVESYWSIKS